MRQSDATASGVVALWFCALALWVMACCAILVTVRIEQVTEKVQEGWREVERLKQQSQPSIQSTRSRQR